MCEQSTVLKTGEAQYSSRLEDIRILKLEVKKLRRERGLLSKSVSNTEELKYIVTNKVLIV